MSPPKTVLITGTSAGGIGSALAIAFQKRGYHVFAAARNPSKAEHLAELPNVETIELDVTSASSVSQAVRTMETKLAGRGLDVLVNNAGVSMTMPLADVDLDAGRALFEVNFWGVLKMAQALLPLLILARGTVVNVSSTGGEMHTPWLGIYSASKAAITCASETLRLELAPIGVNVVTAMIGLVETKIFANGPEVVLPPGSLYLPVQSKLEKTATGEIAAVKMDADVFAERFTGDIVSGAKGKVWRGGNASIMKYLLGWMPTWFLDWQLRMLQGLDTLEKLKMN